MAANIFLTGGSRKLYVMVEEHRQTKTSSVWVSPHPFISGAYYSDGSKNFPKDIAQLQDTYHQLDGYAGMSLFEYLMKAMDGKQVD
jgi:hypothetical protein